MLSRPLASLSSFRGASVAEGKLVYAVFSAVVFGFSFGFVVTARAPTLSKDLDFKWIARWIGAHCL